MSWMMTRDGKKLNLDDPSPDALNIETIAHALAGEQRFAGQIAGRYYVAQHSVLVSQMCKNYPLTGLCHDFTEAYLKDLPRPVKAKCPGYVELERKLWKVVAKKYGLLETLPAEVIKADDVILATEVRDFGLPCDGMWNVIEKPLPRKIVAWSAETAERELLRRFHELVRQGAK